jgi:hypothetical protein
MQTYNAYGILSTLNKLCKNADNSIVLSSSRDFSARAKTKIFHLNPSQAGAWEGEYIYVFIKTYSHSQAPETVQK